MIEQGKETQPAEHDEETANLCEQATDNPGKYLFIFTPSHGQAGCIIVCADNIEEAANFNPADYIDEDPSEYAIDPVGPLIAAMGFDMTPDDAGEEWYVDRVYPLAVPQEKGIHHISYR